MRSWSGWLVQGAVAACVLAVGPSGWAADRPYVPEADVLEPQAANASADSQVISGRVVAMDFRHPTAPSVSVRCDDGTLVKVRVDPDLTSVSDSQASSELGALQRVRLDQRVTIILTPTAGELRAGLITIHPSPSASAGPISSARQSPGAPDRLSP